MSPPDLTERLIRLRTVPVLSALPSADLALLARSLRFRTFEKGEALLREDERPRSFWLLGNGTVTMQRLGRTIGTVRAPGGVGFLSMLARSAGGTSAIAETLVEAYEVRMDAIEDIFEDHFPVLLSTMRFVSERMFAELRKRPPPPFVPPTDPLDHLVGDAPLGVVERIFLLRRTRAFANANVNSLATVARRMEEIRVPGGTVLWRTGERAEHTYFLVKGMAQTVWDEGRSRQRVGPGYVVGGAETLTGNKRWNDLVADEPMVVLRADREMMLDLFEDDLELASSFLSVMATTLVKMWDENAERGLTSVGAP
jgi:CRP-like cAMP-binding protein